MLRLGGLLLRRRAPGCAHTCLSRCALLRGSVRVSAPPSPPQRQLGLLTSLRDALGLAGRDTSGHLETPSPGRDEILEARATQASAELRRLLRDGDSTQPAWGMTHLRMTHFGEHRVKSTWSGGKASFRSVCQAGTEAEGREPPSGVGQRSE